MNAIKIKFKKGPAATGLARASGQRRNIDILTISGENVGNISYSNRSSANPEGTSKWKIQLKVRNTPTEKDPCDWRNIILKRQFDTDKEAQQWIKDHINQIHAQLQIFYLPLTEPTVQTTPQV
jgi:hypothetical protein